MRTPHRLGPAKEQSDAEHGAQPPARTLRSVLPPEEVLAQEGEGRHCMP
jgi:hypothetical protein